MKFTEAKDHAELQDMVRAAAWEFYAASGVQLHHKKPKTGALAQDAWRARAEKAEAEAAQWQIAAGQLLSALLEEHGGGS